MNRKAFILVPFLVLLAGLYGFIQSIAINEFYRSRELDYAVQMDLFSLLEIEAIHRIKKEFHSFDPHDFSFKAGEWTVSVHFVEEQAEITYEGSKTVYARLDYDMVLENVLDYQIEESPISDID